MLLACPCRYSSTRWLVARALIRHCWHTSRTTAAVMIPSRSADLGTCSCNDLLCVAGHLRLLQPAVVVMLPQGIL
jgi:hypothetical protein